MRTLQSGSKETYCAQNSEMLARRAKRNIDVYCAIVDVYIYILGTAACLVWMADIRQYLDDDEYSGKSLDVS